jgi:prepilin-type N-terminal cleavage/methylation domain-containing protein
MPAVTRARGATLVELLVALTLLGIVGSAAVAAIRLQTGVRLRIGSRVTAGTRQGEALGPLAADLMLVSARGGDVPAGGATDSTLDLQATLATGFTCAPGSDPRALTVAVLGAAPARAIAPGDSVRLRAAPSDAWRPALISAVASPPAAADCTAAPDAIRLAFTIDSAARAGVGAGVPLHVTRRIRYSFYRASDGGTYLGLREWSHAAGRLSTVQPVAGPFAGDSVRFVYLDDLGRSLAPPVAPAAIATIAVHLGSAPRLREAGAPASPAWLLTARNRR